MKKSFLLKDRDGRACGYLQIQHRVLRCRITGASENGVQRDLILYSDAEQVERFSLALASEEQRFQLSMHEGKTVSGAVLLQDGHMHLTTDERTVQVYERSRRRQEKAEKAKVQPAVTIVSEKHTPPANDSVNELPEQRAIEWPQRRWPAPVCMTEAAYVQGRWTENAETGLIKDQSGR